MSTADRGVELDEQFDIVIDGDIQLTENKSELRKDLSTLLWTVLQPAMGTIAETDQRQLAVLEKRARGVVLDDPRVLAVKELTLTPTREREVSVNVDCIVNTLYGELSLTI